ncbi:uncharacterized protein LOC117516797 isoform X2 [Thalassophryne amazonica]|uniref:uncharacterized protein LOC117516797 isoform X2 n=1 Tax=Thalassophryne amazonica TaxID=390379 RepID=UPI001470E0E7|nr:uncharacterized protein LOC117516797 isoform X2 [Thalassophryne amazonica]
MSKVQILRALVNQRLNAAAEEIFGLFERTIAEYEEELCRSKQENDRQRHLLDATADRQQILVGKEQGPTAKQDQEDPDPPHIKEENLELWTSQEGLQHQDQEVAEMNFQLTPVPVKSETDEKKPQASQLHQRSADYNAETQPGADYEASHSHRNSDPSMCQQPPWILVPQTSEMLFRIQYRGQQQYIKLNRASYASFLKQAKETFNIPSEKRICLVDEMGTEVDEDVFSDVFCETSDILWTLVDACSADESSVLPSCVDAISLSSSLSSDSETCGGAPKRLRIEEASLGLHRQPQIDDSSSHAKELVQRLLETKPGGEKILQEYTLHGEIKDPLRRKLVNIVVGAMIQEYGTAPPMDIRTQYALGIVTLFPCLKDPFSLKGYEHFFDAESNRGYIAWKLKNVQRELSCGGQRSKNRKRRNSSCNSSRKDPPCSSGPEVEREVTAEHQLEGEPCLEAMTALRHCTDEKQIFLKMKQTFKRRQKLVHDPDDRSTVLTGFPRFLDTKGLVLQDFQLLFGEETASKLLEKWRTFLKQKVIKEANNLNRTPTLESLIQSAEESPVGEDSLLAWDSDMSSLLLLVYLLPPPPSGKRGVKISSREAVSRVIKFHESCHSHQEALSSGPGRQPYILAVGTSRKSINEYFIVLDGLLIPCKTNSSLSAFDELFKTHYVFGLSYDQALKNMYTFVQTTIYNIDVGLCQESPRVKDLRAKILN